MAHDPITDEEWLEAAQIARGALLFVSARAYGLVTGGPDIDVARCEELLARAQERGIRVEDDAAATAFLGDILDAVGG